MFQPKFVVNQKILKYISQIEVAKEIIENSPLVPQWEVKFREEAMLRSVHHGTHVEGNQMTLGEVKGALEGRDVPARERDVQEVLNYRNVLRYIDKWSRTESEAEKPIDSGTLLKMHEIVMNNILPPERLAAIRDVDVVLKSSRTGMTSFRPPTHYNVPALVNFFLEWLNSAEFDELHPVLRAGITHYELVRIHPFVDGNGRVSRAMAILVLFKGGYDVKRFFSIEEYFDRDSARYFQTLQNTSNQLVIDNNERDLTEWLEYFSEGLAVELARVKEKVKKLSVDLKLQNRVGQITLNERQMALVEYMEDYGGISNKEWRTLLTGVSDDTVLRDMQDLIKKRLVKKEGTTKASRYKLV
ncbi:MAG: Fic family protein [bacterium]|nr:Fic family protein [bacterium]